MLDLAKTLGVEVAPREEQSAVTDTVAVTIKGFTYDEAKDQLKAHLKEQNVVPYIVEEKDEKGKTLGKKLHYGSSLVINGRISEFTGVIPGATKQEIASLTNVPAVLNISVFEGEVKKYLTPDISDAHINRVIAVRKLNTIGKDADLSF